MNSCNFHVHALGAKSPLLPGHSPQVYNRRPSHLSFLFSFLSLALFAFWLRSSVVSVLFSLISEIFLREKSMIKFIFVTGDGSSRLAYDPLHCVPGLTLPLGDANLFHHDLSKSGFLEKKDSQVRTQHSSSPQYLKVVKYSKSIKLRFWIK